MNIAVVYRFEKDYEIVKNFIKKLSDKSINIDSIDYPNIDSYVFKNRYDYVVVFGGDGTIIGTIKEISGLPIVGVNTGNVGFLAGFTTDDLDLLVDSLKQKKFNLLETISLECSVINQNETHRLTIINDISINNIDATLCDIEVSTKNKRLNKYRADGIIISTPIGSTAYNMSAGGPIVHSNVDAMILTPISPYTLAERSVVLPIEELSLKILNEKEMLLSIDGHKKIKIDSNSKIFVARGENKVKLLFAENRDYFENLRLKLRWGMHSDI